jgi:NADPH-dependent curcumin reductase CurA
MNRKIILIKRPTGMVLNEHVALVESLMPIPRKGECLVKNIYIPVYSSARLMMTDSSLRWERNTFVPLNEVMITYTVGIVHQSDDDALPVGAYVLGIGNVQEFYITKSSEPTTTKLQEIPSLPLTAYISFLSPMCAAVWVSIFEILNVQPGEVVVVSSAASTLGTLAGQLAKIAGAYVIGIAGADEKVDYITKELNFDAGINYKHQNIAAEIRSMCPDGVDCFFDIVGGGPITDAVLTMMKVHGRVSLAGILSAVDSPDSSSSIQNMHSVILQRRLSLQGVLCLDYSRRLPDILPSLIRYIVEGKIKYQVDMRRGLENFVQYLRDISEGRNRGRVVIDMR